MADMFEGSDQNQIDPNIDYMAELVGDGKKFKTPADLARGKFEADRHIENLTKTLNEAREELRTRKTEEDLINRIAQLQNRQTETPREQPPAENREQASGLTKEDVDRMFAERETASRQNTNLNEVQSRLAERFGNGAAVEIEKKSQELGVSKDEMRRMAATQPKVFLALFANTPVQTPDIFGAPQGRGGQLTPTGVPTGVRKWSDFQKLKRENSAEYFGAKIQKEILAIGDRLGGPGNPAYDAWRNS